MAFFLPPLARGQRRRAPLDLARERQRGASHLVERPAPLDAHVDVHAARARRLRPADEAEVVERRAHDAGDLADLRPLDAGHRIEIDAQFVGMIEIVGAHRMRVQLEAGEVRHPGERGGIARHDFLRAAAGREAQRHDVDPRRAATSARASGRRTRRRCRWDSGRARSAARPRRQRALRDGEVVAREIELGVAGLRKEHFRGFEIATSRPATVRISLSAPLGIGSL